MGQVTVTLNGRTYRLRCEDGEEERLLRLGNHVRSHVDRLTREFGQVGDDRLLAMAAILIADELFELRERPTGAEQPGKKAEKPRAHPSNASKSDDGATNTAPARAPPPVAKAV